GSVNKLLQPAVRMADMINQLNILGFVEEVALDDAMLPEHSTPVGHGEFRFIAQHVRKIVLAGQVRQGRIEDVQDQLPAGCKMLPDRVEAGELVLDRQQVLKRPKGKRSQPEFRRDPECVLQIQLAHVRLQQLYSRPYLTRLTGELL